VAGCLPKAEKGTIEKFYPRASLLGPNSLQKTLEVIDSTINGTRKIELGNFGQKLGLPKLRLNPTIGIIQISSGCMSECTFCQTKLSKGDLVSYRVGDIVRQIKQEINDGCKEIWLTSTDNGCYGLDIGSNLPELIETVSAIEGNFMVRVGMMNPMYMPRIREGLLQAYQNDKVFKFLHVPVQSGSDQVLHDMKRGHTAQTFKDVVNKFRNKFPVFTISTDIIVGYPTEKEEDFQETLDLLYETKPDIVNLSRYSQRPGTESATLKQLKPSEVKRRSKIVFELIKKISFENNKKWIGWKGDVLFDEKSDKGIKGRNFAYKPILVHDHVKIGNTYKIKIVDVTNNYLLGTIVS
jgi:MiaB-like tRNA modifying enzyme